MDIAIFSPYYLVKEFPVRLIGLIFLLFFAILFLQSGLDKLNDRKGNMDWLTGHFAKSPFKNHVGTLLSLLTGMELLAGIGSLLLAPVLMLFKLKGLVLLAPFGILSFCTFTLLNLFLGQRIAKDYAGAAGIVPYLIVGVLGMVYFSMFLDGSHGFS